MAWYVFRLSRRMSHSSMPSAQNTLAARGTMTTVEPTSSAILQACIEQAPPALTRANSRGSWPRCTETTFVASAMFWLMIRNTPAAASTSDILRGSPMTRFMTASAAFSFTFISPPRKKSLSR